MRPAAALIVASIPICLAPLAHAQEDAATPWVGDAMGAFSYGIYCSEPPVELREAPETASGVVNIMPGIPEFLFEQTLVPAQLGISFGVVFDMAPEAAIDAAVVTITHPPYPDTGIEVERWATSIDGEGENLVGFTFELTSELVTGPWVFRAESGADVLFEIAFEVVPPSLLPDAASACQRAILS
ncbi:MAG: DUF3859 domain-containing protein [Pseudomonadota bacterium]